MANPEDPRMRRMLFAVITTLAVAFGNLAAASAAPALGDGGNTNPVSTTTPGYSVTGG
jgi:hypothetical protein